MNFTVEGLCKVFGIDTENCVNNIIARDLPKGLKHGLFQHQHKILDQIEGFPQPMLDRLQQLRLVFSLTKSLSLQKRDMKKILRENAAPLNNEPPILWLTRDAESIEAVYKYLSGLKIS